MTTKKYPPVDWSKPIMLEGHGTLLRVVRGLNRDGDWVCELVEGAWPNGDRGARYFSGDGRREVLGQEWRVVNAPETPDLSQQAAEVCARLSNASFPDECWEAADFLAVGSELNAFRRTIELCLKHIDALPDELREHIRPPSDDERLLRKAREWVADNYAAQDCHNMAGKARTGRYDDSSHVADAVNAFITGYKAAQS